jgi:hypothetical protein
MDSSGKPETLGQVYRQAGAVAMATQNATGELQWTVLQNDGTSTDTWSLASTHCWQQLHDGVTP